MSTRKDRSARGETYGASPPKNESKLSRVDPRPKLMFMLSVSTVALLTNDLRYVVALLVVTIITLAVGGADMIFALRRARALFAVIFFLFVVQSIFYADSAAVSVGELIGTSGVDTSAVNLPASNVAESLGISAVNLPAAHTALLHIGSFEFVYTGGILFAALLSLRLLVLVFAGLILLEGAVRDYLLALVQMKVPYEIAFMVLVGLHFLPVLREEAVNIYCFMQLRGRDFKKLRIVQKLRAYASICLPILVAALRRIDESSVAMELRGFRAKEGRTYMRSLKMRGTDIALTIFFPLLFAGIYVVYEIFKNQV